MIKNYFYLNRFVIEANELLKVARIGNIFSQEKDKLIIECRKNESTLFLEIFVNPGEPHINLRENYSRAKKNSVELFQTIKGQHIQSFNIATDDRIIKIKFDNAQLYFTIRGKYTNVFVDYPNRVFKSFKKIDEDILKELVNELESKTYISKYHVPDLSLIPKDDFYRAVKQDYPIIGNDIIKELKRRVTSENEDKSLMLGKILNEIIDEHISVFINRISGEIHLAPISFDIFEYTEKKSFDSLIKAQSFFLANKRFVSEKQRLAKLITKHLDRELKKTANKLNNLTVVVQRESKEKEYQQIGNLLLINLVKIKTGMESIEIENIYGSNEKVKVKLNPKLHPKKNVDYYFDKAKAEKISFIKSKELLKLTKNKFNELKEIEVKLHSVEDLKKLKELMKVLKIRDKDSTENKDEIKMKFKHYIIDAKFHLYVGRDSKNNDLLTTKFAKQNDYWFHARSVSGSHVVMRVENTKDLIPKNVLKKAAALAAFHSKAKTAGVVPVAYTFKKYVIKKKGYPTGTVHLLKEDVLLVKPEIPEGCEFVTNE